MAPITCESVIIADRSVYMRNMDRLATSAIGKVNALKNYRKELFNNNQKLIDDNANTVRHFSQGMDFRKDYDGSYTEADLSMAGMYNYTRLENGHWNLSSYWNDFIVYEGSLQKCNANPTPLCCGTSGTNVQRWCCKCQKGSQGCANCGSCGTSHFGGDICNWPLDRNLFYLSIIRDQNKNAEVKRDADAASLSKFNLIWGTTAPKEDRIVIGCCNTIVFGDITAPLVTIDNIKQTCS